MGWCEIPISSALTLEPQIVWPTPSSTKKMPMVAMKRMMCGWLTSGRSTSRSMTKATTIITRAARMKAMIQCRPASMKPTIARAAKSTMPPWAKLKMDEALKIKTKPSATRAYMTPCSRPFTRTSR